MLVCSPGATTIIVSTTDEASLPEMTMATVCVKSMCILWKASDRSCGVGCGRIGAYPKRNSQSTWGSSSLCTTCASEAKRCLVRSLSYSSHKTLESDKSVLDLPSALTRLLTTTFYAPANLVRDMLARDAARKTNPPTDGR